MRAITLALMCAVLTLSGDAFTQTGTTKPRLKVPSADIQMPLPIPILAKPTKDRASLADPAFEASLDATLKKVTPTRDTPVPFTPLNLPDPFENQRYGELRNPPEESATPPVIPLERPTK